MARGRLISRSLGSSRKFYQLLETGGKLGEFCQVLFPLLIANSDDFGRLPGDGFTVKNVVLPSSPRQERDFDRALDVIADVGLADRYQVDGAVYLQIVQFDAHQPNLHKRAEKSRFPEYPGVSGNFRTIPGKNLIQSNLIQSNLRESNPEPRTAVRSGVSLFDAFWAAYPRKKAKEDARRAWDKHRPDAALLQVILSSLQQQGQSSDWKKNHGRYIPYPATWLTRGQWTDSAEVVGDGLSETARYNLEASDEAERLILENEARRGRS